MGRPVGLGMGLGIGLDGCRGETDSPKSWLCPTGQPQPLPVSLPPWGRRRAGCPKPGPAITTHPERGRQRDSRHPAQGCSPPALQCPNLRHRPRSCHPTAPPAAQTPAAFPPPQPWIRLPGPWAAVPRAGRCLFPWQVGMCQHVCKARAENTASCDTPPTAPPRLGDHGIIAIPLPPQAGTPACGPTAPPAPCPCRGICPIPPPAPARLVQWVGGPGGCAP